MTKLPNYSEAYRLAAELRAQPSRRLTETDAPASHDASLEDASLAFFGEAGFEFWTTGGGCTAYGRNLEDDNESYILITDEDAGHPVIDGEIICVGFYDNDKHFDGTTAYAKSFAEAVVIANRLIAKHLGYDQDALLDRASASETLSDACRIIQRELGQTDGGLAGHHFCGESDHDETGAWSGFDGVKRREILLPYLNDEEWSLDEAWEGAPA